MAVTIDYTTFTINIPRNDLTLVQTNPTEIRDMGLDWFRRELKAIEDTELGIPYSDTHNHNTEVSLGGLTYARVIEILDPYSVTFEDGQYAVNLVGANSNVGDKVNVNQVSVRSANSAGMTSSPAIEYSSFNGGVTLDLTTSYYGTAYPTGTPQMAVNNLADAMLIADFRGFTTIYVVGDAVIDSGGDYREMVFIGASKTKSILNVSSASQVDNCEFYDCHITGVLDGDSTLKDCLIDDLDYVTGYIEQCVLDAGIILLGSGATAHFLDCWSGVPGTGTPTIDCGGTGQALAMRNYNGGIKLINKTGTESVSIDLNSGQVKLDLTTVTKGTIVVRGLGKVIESTSGEDLPTGFYGDLFILNEAINRDNISGAVLDTSISEHQDPDTVGWTFAMVAYGYTVSVDEINGTAGTNYPLGTPAHPVNNINDALTLAVTYQCSRLIIHSDVVFETTHNINDMIIEGHEQDFSVTLNTPSTAHTKFIELDVTGTLNGRSSFQDCIVHDISGLTGTLDHCLFYNDIHLCTTCPDPTIIRNSSALDLTGPSIYPGVGGFITTAFSGRLSVVNMTQGVVGLGGDFCQFVLESTCTGGVIAIGTKGTIIDNSTGTFVGLANSLTPDSIAAGLLNTSLLEFKLAHTVGEAFNDISYTEKAIYINTEAVTNGNGKSSEPFNNISDAVDFAEAVGWRSLIFLADATLERTMKNFVIEGIGLPTIDLNGQNIDKSEFFKVKLTGAQAGNMTCREVILLPGISNLNGAYKEVGMISNTNYTIANASTVSFLSISVLPLSPLVAPSSPVIDYGVAYDNQIVTIRKASGSFQLANMNTANKILASQFNGGGIKFLSSCTDGIARVAGIPDSAVVNEGTINVNIDSVLPSAATVAETVLNTVSS